MDRMPSLDERNLCKVLTALQKLNKEERPRAIFNNEFSEVREEGPVGGESCRCRRLLWKVAS